MNPNGGHVWTTQEDHVRIPGPLLQQEFPGATTQAGLQLLASLLKSLTLFQRSPGGRSAQVALLTFLRFVELIDAKCPFAF
jgi:hypothetical protein